MAYAIKTVRTTGPKVFMTLPEAATQIYLTVRSIPLAVTLWDQTHGKRDLGSLRRKRDAAFGHQPVT